jgi:hypothetical protein
MDQWEKAKNMPDKELLQFLRTPNESLEQKAPLITEALARLLEHTVQIKENTAKHLWRFG